jgi:hypothetical protein
MKLIQEKPLKKEPKIQHKIISKFVDPASFSEKYFWPREMKIANTLCKKYNPDFLLWVIPPYNKKIPSLAYFIADYGQQYLQEQFFNYKKSISDFSPKYQEIMLSQNKIGEDTVFKKQPKSLKDFLNLYK